MILMTTGPRHQLVMRLAALLLFGVSWCLQDGLSGIDAFQQSTEDRWTELYSRLLPDVIKTEWIGDVVVAEFVGYPAAGLSKFTHNQGGRVEQVGDRVVLGEYVRDLKEGYGCPPSVLAFKVLDGWASPEYYAVLQSAGFEDVEVSTIMSIGGIDELVEPRPLHDGYLASKVSSLEDLTVIAEAAGSSAEHILTRFTREMLKDNRIAFWQIKHIASGATVCYGLIEVIKGIAGIHMVETHQEHRRKGLASALVAQGIRHAYTHHELHRVVLGSTPGAVQVYARLGFKVEGKYHSYDPIRGLHAFKDPAGHTKPPKRDLFLH